MSLIGEIFKELTLQSVKFFTLLIISFYYQFINKKRPLPVFKYIKYIALTLLIRDFVYSLVRVANTSFQLGIIDNGRFLLLISDIIVLLFYLFWLRAYTGKKQQDLVFYLINVFFFLMLFGNVFFFKFYGENDSGIGTYSLILLGIFFITLIYLSVNIMGISVYNTENADIILVTKPAIILVFGLIGIVIYLIMPNVLALQETEHQQAIEVEYKCGDSSPKSNQIKPLLNIKNTTSKAIPLSRITIRYYYTKEGDASEEFSVDYAAIGKTNITGDFYDGYVEIGFIDDAGILPITKKTGEIHIRINRTDSTLYNQMNDYSFNDSFRYYKNWDQVTVYQNGIKISGKEPREVQAVLDTFIILQSLIISLGYLLHIFILYKYNDLFDREQMQELKFISNDLESLFEYMRVLSTTIGEKKEQDEVLAYVIESTVKTTSAEAGAILKVDEYEDILKVKAVSGFFPPLYAVPEILIKQRISSIDAYFKSTPIRLGETLLGEVAKSGKPRFIKQSRDEPLLSYNTNNNTLYVNSVIIIPLVIQKRVLGVLAVLNREKDKVFSENDFEHLKTFGEYAALTIDFLDTYMEVIEKREIEKELEIAKDIQQKLLPKKIPRMNDVELQAYSIPAKGVSGDYYDILQLKGNKIGIVICDVAGKGYPAAMVMVMIRSILHLIAFSDREIATILTWVNRGISGQIDIDHYATMSMFSFDQESRELIYSNAAHHPLLIYRKKTNQIEPLDTEGLPIGIERTTRYGQKRAKLMSGDIVTMYTDGIIEAMNTKGEQYSAERFHDLLLNNVDKTAKELVDLIKADLAVFVGKADQHDDQTLILMKVN